MDLFLNPIFYCLTFLFFLLKYTAQKNENMAKNKKENSGVKKRFSFRIHRKSEAMSQDADPETVVKQKTTSAARVSKTLQIDDRGLSYAGKHLMLLIQHQVDAGLIKVPSKNVSWKALVALNQDVDLTEKKAHVKQICGIHRFGPETQEIADRVTTFVSINQKKNVVEI